MDWDKTQLIGENLKEYELLQFPSVTQAYYIQCPTCTVDHSSNPAVKAFYDGQAADIDKDYQVMLEDQDANITSIPPQSDTQSLTDASTVDDPALATPYFGVDHASRSSRRKRKAAPESFKLDMMSLDDSGLMPSPCGREKDDHSARTKRSTFPGHEKAKSTKRLRMTLSSPRFPLSDMSS